MGNLGGGAVHGAMGMRVWTDQVGLLSYIGEDFPVPLSNKLKSYFDTRGVLSLSISSPRVWLLCEVDGSRNEVFRTDYEEMVNHSCQPQDYYPMDEDLAGVYLQSNPIDIPAWTERLRTRGNTIILWEPWDQFCVKENYHAFCDLAALVDVVSPNLHGARELTGCEKPEKIIDSMLKNGAHMIALRMGAAGSLVANRETGIAGIPPFHVENIVDVTGAGNSYCGGFIFGMCKTMDPKIAGIYGSVSASFSLEQFGALFPLENLSKRANFRLAKLISRGD